MRSPCPTRLPQFTRQWFLAVHAAIPFVAMLRKAVLMPKWAILLTLIGSSEWRLVLVCKRFGWLTVGFGLHTGGRSAQLLRLPCQR